MSATGHYATESYRGAKLILYVNTVFQYLEEVM